MAKKNHAAQRLRFRSGEAEYLIVVVGLARLGQERLAAVGLQQFGERVGCSVSARENQPGARHRRGGWHIRQGFPLHFIEPLGQPALIHLLADELRHRAFEVNAQQITDQLAGGREQTQIADDGLFRFRTRITDRGMAPQFIEAQPREFEAFDRHRHVDVVVGRLQRDAENLQSPNRAGQDGGRIAAHREQTRSES